jgi:uncharacterized protein (DUF305 family)
MIRGLTWAAVAALTLAAFTACASTQSTTHAEPTTPAVRPTTSGVANSGSADAADAVFVATLTRLGGQNLTMAGLVASRAAHAELATLVPSIQLRSRDLDAMRDWMNEWHTRWPAATATPSGITDSMLGVMAAMHGAMFDDDWLEHMGANYSAAITACRYELAHGTNPQARQMASSWMRWMIGQLDTMRRWHAAWMHDGRFPPMMSAGGNATGPGTSTPVPHPSDMPYGGTAQMSTVPHAAPSTGPYPAMTSRMSTHMSGVPHMSSPAR